MLLAISCCMTLARVMVACWAWLGPADAKCLDQLNRIPLLEDVDSVRFDGISRQVEVEHPGAERAARMT